MTTYRRTRRDLLAAHLVDLALVVATPGFREIVRSGAQRALVDAIRPERQPAPSLNPDFFTAADDGSDL